MEHKFTKMIVHYGSAHRDDFLCCAVALAASMETLKTIERRNPTSEELEDPAVLVCDVGGEYAPEKSNYDHHQFLPEDDGRCAFDLLVEGLGFNGFKPSLFPWMRATSLIDTQGPFRAAAELKVPMESMQALLSPAEEFLIDEFSREECVERGDPLYEVMFRMGIELCRAAADMSVRFTVMRRALDAAVDVGGVGVVVIADQMSSLDSKALAAARNAKLGTNVAVCISKDDRGPGWSLYRFDDDPRVNFSQIEEDPLVTFAHRGGFIAKTHKIESHEALELVRKSLV